MIQCWFPFGSSPRPIPFLPITTVQGLPVQRRVLRYLYPYNRLVPVFIGTRCHAPIGLMALTKLPYSIWIIHASSAEWKIPQ